MGLRYLLHVGCGSPSNKVPFEFSAYKEVRLDKNKNVQPDIVASIVDMPMVEDESQDAILCSHVLEHLYTHEVAMALTEFLRVLKPGGKLFIQAPDLQSIGAKLALDKADFVIYESHIGLVSPLDMIYGHQASVGAGNLHMAHKTGFTAGIIQRRLEEFGFRNVKTERDKFEIKAWAYKGTANAGEESSAESASECEVRPCVGEEASLRQQRETALACE